MNIYISETRSLYCAKIIQSLKLTEHLKGQSFFCVEETVTLKEDKAPNKKRQLEIKI